MNKIFAIFFLPLIIFAQTTKYPQAPEIWSKPEKIKAISDWAGTVGGASVSSDGKTLYMAVSGIAVSHLSDTGWTTPYKLPSNINRDYYVESPAITPGGNRLFYNWRIGDYSYLFYSNRDTVNDEWSDPVYCGDEVSRYPGVDGATAPDDTTIIFLRSSMAYIGFYNDSTKEYDNVRDFPNEG